MAKKRDYGDFEVTKRRTSWRAVVSLPKDPVTNKRRRKVFTAKSKAGAIEAAREFQRLDSMGLNIEAGDTLLRDYLPEWVDRYCTSQNLKNSSRVAYKGMTNNVVELMGNLTLSGIKPHHLSEFVAKRGEIVTASTVRSYRLLRMCLEDCEINGLIERTPFARHRAPKYPRAKESRFLNDEEITKLLKAAEGTRLQRPIAFLLATGIRSSELFALRKSDLHLGEGENYVTIRANVRTANGPIEWGDAKTIHGLRSIDLSEETVRLVEAHIGTLLLEQAHFARWEDPSLLFPSTTGTVWQYRNFKKLWDQIIKKAGIAPAGPHSLRHSHASHSIRAGEQLIYLSRRLGHGSVAQTTEIYGHLLKDGQEISSQVMDRFIVHV